MARKTESNLVEPLAWPQTIRYDGDLFTVIGRHHILVKAKSEEGHYAIDLEPVDDLPPSCSCRSFETRGSCRHMAKARQLVGLDR